MREVLLVAAGGAIGAAARYVVGLMITSRTGPGFPWHTLLINVTGAFLIGVLFALPLGGTPSAAAWRLFLATGILGGFTTFSALSFESVDLIARGQALSGLANIFGSGVAGLLAAWAGLTVGRLL